MQKQAPTREESEALLEGLLDSYTSNLEANDAIYQFQASRNYDPQPHLSKITAPLLAINSADDQINPPELRILETEIRKVENGKAIVLPITDETRGHGTHSIAALWQDHLAALLKETER
jgi:homoserine O-acetyltransferase